MTNPFSTWYPGIIFAITKQQPGAYQIIPAMCTYVDQQFIKLQVPLPRRQLQDSRASPKTVVLRREWSRVLVRSIFPEKQL